MLKNNGEIYQKERKKILVVDDDWGTRNLLKFKLSRLGYKVITAGNEREFLKRAIDTSPHLIMVDLWLGNRWGTRLYDTLLALGFDPEVPVIFITGLVDGKEPLHSDSYAFHMKPFDFGKLIHDIDRMISRPHVVANLIDSRQEDLHQTVS